MHCEVTLPELASFYFGDVEEEARARIETHLRGCPSCLDAYLALKRSVEAADLEPTEADRLRLRAAVAHELSAAEPAPWLWWERPVAVAFAMAAVALTTIMVGEL